jgi:hypothetical protein
MSPCADTLVYSEPGPLIVPAFPAVVFDLQGDTTTLPDIEQVMFDHLFSLGESFFCYHYICTMAPRGQASGFSFFGECTAPPFMALIPGSPFRNFLVNDVLLLAILPISRTLRKAGWNGRLVSC